MADQVRMIGRDARNRQRAARMADKDGPPYADGLDEAVGVIRDRIHREVGLGLRIVGESHAELVNRINVKLRRQVIEDRRPCVG